jgi:hypothetical protein
MLAHDGPGSVGELAGRAVCALGYSYVIGDNSHRILDAPG